MNELSDEIEIAIELDTGIEIKHRFLKRTQNQSVRGIVRGNTPASSNRKLYLCGALNSLMADRAEKWAAKLSGSNRKLIIDRQKKQMSKLEAEATEALVKIETEVKTIAQGESIIHLPYYIIFGKELYRLRTKHRSMTLVREAEILEEKWRARGLRYDLLEKIKIFYIESYKTQENFKFDISELDGPHVLA
jgi:hypothetical protein